MFEYRITVGKKSSGVGVDGHDVLLIPHAPSASPHPTNPTGGAGRGVGHVGLGGWGGALGAWGIRILCMYAYIHTLVGTRITAGKK